MLLISYSTLTLTISWMRLILKFQSSWIASFSKTSFRLPEINRILSSLTLLSQLLLHLTLWTIFGQDQNGWSGKINAGPNESHSVFMVHIPRLLYFPQQGRRQFHLLPRDFLDGHSIPLVNSDGRKYLRGWQRRVTGDGGSASVVHAKLLEIDCKSNSIRQQESLPLGLIFVDPFCSRTAAPLPRESHQDERAKTCCSARCSIAVAW